MPNATFNTSSDVVSFPTDSLTKHPAHSSSSSSSTTSSAYVSATSSSSSSSTAFGLPLPFSTVAKLRGDCDDAEAIVENDELQQHNSELQQRDTHTTRQF